MARIIETECSDQVFCVRDKDREVWRCIVGGKVYGDWTQKGPAVAGMQVEQRRLERRTGQARAGYRFDNVDAP